MPRLLDRGSTISLVEGQAGEAERARLDLALAARRHDGAVLRQSLRAHAAGWQFTRRPLKRRGKVAGIQVAVLDQSFFRPSDAPPVVAAATQVPCLAPRLGFNQFHENTHTT